MCRVTDVFVLAVPVAVMDRRELLFHLAEDAFDVLNWARRIGLKRDQQLEQVVEAFEKTLTETKAKIDAA